MASAATDRTRRPAGRGRGGWRQVRQRESASRRRRRFPRRPLDCAAAEHGHRPHARAWPTTLLEDGSHDEDFLDRCCVGWDRLAAYLTGRGRRHQARCRVGGRHHRAWTPPPCVSWLVSSRRHRTVIAVSWSLQRAHHGEQPYWAAVALAAMSGSMGRPGGGFGGRLRRPRTSIGRRRPPVADRRPNQPSQYGARPSSPWPASPTCSSSPGREIDYDGQAASSTRTSGSSTGAAATLHHHQDLHRLVRAWQRPETVVVHDSMVDPDRPLRRHRAARGDDARAGRLRRLGSSDLWLIGHAQGCRTARRRTDRLRRLRRARRSGSASRRISLRVETAEEWVRHLYESSRDALKDRGVDIPSSPTSGRPDGWSCPIRRRQRGKLCRPPRRARGEPAHHAFGSDRALLGGDRRLRV